MTPPTLQTPRLILRPHRAGDIAPMRALWTDPEATRFIGGPENEEEIWKRLLRYAGCWPLLGYGWWAVTAREGGDYLGDAGLADWRRDMRPPLGKRPEVGWMLARKAHGAGYATEAGGAVLGWADATLESAETVAIFHPENAPSMRVAAKLGFAATADAAYKGYAMRVMERPRGAASLSSAG